MSKRIKCKIEVESIRYYKGDWGIISAAPTEIKEGTINSSKIIVKGNMPRPNIGEEYYLVANEVDDPKWGMQYDAISMVSVVGFDTTDEKAKYKYLSHLFTESQLEALYSTLEDPYVTLNNRDYEALVKVKGCGLINAIKWCDRFEEKISLGKLYIELEDYNLTNGIMKKLLAYYKSPELIIQQVKENPYVLTNVAGIGFKTADEIAMNAGIQKWDIRRIGSYILYMLQIEGQNGNSFISAQQLMDGLVEMFGDDIPDLAIAETLHDEEVMKRVWWDDNKEWIGLRRYRELEANLKDEVMRLMNSEPTVTLSGMLDDKINEIEKCQGWSFTDQQREALHIIEENNLTIVNGAAGCGKTTLASAVIKMYEGKSSAACCLSGKAAARLGEVIGTSGSTIHRLLGYNPQTGFNYCKEDPLACDLIIIDEISMIGGSLFLSLLEAIKSGAKVVMLGDTGQLESIGECNVAYDLISSGAVPLVTLTKVHRQAQKSAIITESFKVRNGQHLISKDWAGCETRGEYQDFIIDCFSDKSNTYHKTLEYFKQEYEAVGRDIFKIQILSPVKNRGDASVWTLNKAIQDYCNPDEGQESVRVYYQGRGEGVLREGDKVINVKNNYRTFNTEGVNVPIFNGNMGQIVKIDLANEMVIVDFFQIGLIVLPTSGLDTLELGYAITVHKFQGAQTEVVIVALDFGAYTLLTKELVYTGITRAQKKCILVAQNSALRYAISRTGTTEKNTHLAKLLYDEVYGEKPLVF